VRNLFCAQAVIGQRQGNFYPTTAKLQNNFAKKLRARGDAS
jgi:hypothetical protein